MWPFMPGPKPKAFLALRKALTGKRAIPKELGYERDPKTGRLIDSKNSSDPKTRAKAIKEEALRRNNLKKRQLTNWIKKLNVALKEYNDKHTVLDIKESLFKKLFEKEILEKKRHLKSNHVLFEEKLRDKFNSIYYTELHSTIKKRGPEKLKTINYLEAHELLKEVSIKISTHKVSMLIEIKKQERGNK